MAQPYWIEDDLSNIWIMVDNLEAGASKVFYVRKEEGYAPNFDDAPPANFFDDFNRPNSDVIGNRWIESEGTYSYVRIYNNVVEVVETTPSGGVYVSTVYRRIPSAEPIKQIQWKYYSPYKSYIMRNEIGFLRSDLSRVLGIGMDIDNTLDIYVDNTEVATSSLEWSEGSFQSFSATITKIGNEYQVNVFRDSALYVSYSGSIPLNEAVYFYFVHPDGYHQTGYGSARVATYKYDSIGYTTFETPPDTTVLKLSDELFQLTITNTTSETLNTTIPIACSELEITSTSESLNIGDFSKPAYLICRGVCNL